MLEGLVAWVINNYLGKYVENLNTDQLSIALLRGAVELENLPLRKDALRQVGLPIQVKAGLIGKVKLKIPLTQVRTAPWEIFMEQLYLVAGPLNLTELDEEAEEQALQDYKLGRLDAIEAVWRQTETSQDSSYYASSYSSWLGLSMNFAANIIENLQLKIKDVHIRYEDNITVDGKVFAAGVQIESLTAQSCDDSWNPSFVSCSSKESFKLMEMTGFSIYWDQITQAEMWGDLLLSHFVGNMARTASHKHSYILSPVHAVAHFKRNRSEKPLRSRTHPRVVCDLLLDQVPLSLTDVQYCDMVCCKRGLVSLARRHGHIRSRPKKEVSVDPRSWWMYAINRILKPVPTWSMTLIRARENIAYVALYSKMLLNPTDHLLQDDKNLKDKVEWERDFDELRDLREISMRRVRPPGKVVKVDGSVGLLASWFPGWWQSSQTESANLNPDPGTAALEEQILDALADSVENNTLLKRDVVFGQFNFTLKTGTFHLCSGSEALMELQFENVQLGLESRPRNGSHCVNITLGAIYLRDHLFKDSAFPVLISPQRSDSAPTGRLSKNLPPGLAKIVTQNVINEKEQPLFQLSYEYKPFNSSADRRLEVHLKSLDVVYNPGSTKWMLEFFTGPHQVVDSGLRQAARQGYHAMKRKTKQQLLSNWESMVYGHAAVRKTWDIELDISAPQIFLVEHFNDKNAILCVVDLGKLHFTNRIPGIIIPVQENGSTEVEEEEEEEAFQTPCSTPPGSEVSSQTSSRNPSVDMANINELLLHNKLYDKYIIDLCDLQILVGCVRDNWKYAHLRGSSSLHILDKFNISLHMERRVIHTIDPQYPSLTITGNLPKLVAHVNEDKVKAIQTLVNVISGKGLISPMRSQENSPGEETLSAIYDDDSISEEEKDTGARLLMLQFSIDQMALEVQSRGRSIAELQVNGVKASFTKRPYDTSLSLSVHGLLLVDALQTFGPDFELLIASHKHVGMDSVSGSLQDSEPTSPISPASPEPEGRARFPSSPVSISQALSSINIDRAKSPVGRIPSPPQIKIPLIPANELPDTEALISVEFLFVNADCPTNEEKKEHLQVANIQFNNLDIIANQETIVELVGFIHRAFPKHKNAPHFPTPLVQADVVDHGEINGHNHQPSISHVVSTRTQVTFDFHRLNVLLLRAVVTENGVIGRKIATATMTEAKINANVGTSLEVEGSLGGLQIIDLTPEGHMHQRILSLGEDPLTNKSKGALTLAQMAADMYNMSGYQASLPVYNNQAFSFSVKRSTFSHDTDIAEIKIRMASVWYVHSSHILYEFKSCAAEFKQYLSNLFMSIKSAATEMAIGIVHARAESLAQSLSMGGRLYGSSSDISQTPRKRRSLSYSIDHLESSRGSVTPHSPAESSYSTMIKWDVVLASPVVVLPRNSSSPQVAVAHLGSISVTNTSSSPVSSPWGIGPSNEKYTICVTAMNLYTLDISKRLNRIINLSESSLIRAEDLYCSRSDGIPVLHNTSAQLTVIREMSHVRMKQQDDILLDSGADFFQVDHQDSLQVQGSIINGLKLSLSRGLYEQLLETVDTVLTPVKGEADDKRVEKVLANIQEEPEINTGVSTLSMDSALRARMMVAHSTAARAPPLPSPQGLSLTVGFELPLLSLELIADLGSGEQKLVDLSFKELIIQYEQSQCMETSIQISLHSVNMEDLQKPEDSKHRFIMVSSRAANSEPSFSGYVSKSCPNLSSPQSAVPPWHFSLPDHLETGEVLGAVSTRHRHVVVAENSIENRMRGTQPKCPYTPPPSPRGKMSPAVFREDNLVHVNIITKPSRLNKFVKSRQVNVDFNSLDVIVNVESWVVVLDFFGISDLDQATLKKDQTTEPAYTPTSIKKFPEQIGVDSELELTVRSLSVVLNRAEYEVARAVMTNLSSRLVSAAGSGFTETEASVGSFSLSDLTPNHSQLYRERFITAGLKLSMVTFNSPDPMQLRPYDLQLKMDMTSLVYVHTQRYVAEIQAFFNLFPHLRREVGYFRGKMLEDDENAIFTRILIEVHAPSPIIILPMSSQCTSCLVADLGNLTINNCLKKSNEEGVISKSIDQSKEILLNVMNIVLESMDIVTGERINVYSEFSHHIIPVGSYYVKRKSGSLLKEKCHLKLQVERNLMKYQHSVPDITIHGTLSTLAARLLLNDYKLISGLLSFNIGECLDDLLIPEITPAILRDDDYDIVWTHTSMKFELVDVSVSLIPSNAFDLACINFIKSSLTVDIYSNRTQDIDLVSEEILITDIRFLDKPANKRSNVFTNILQPIHCYNNSDTVQAQIHHRKNIDSSKFTILLNNMRLMAIVDWWESVRDFIMTKPDYIPPVSALHSNLQHDFSPKEEQQEMPFELKLNITDSEVVVVEDSSQWDTNAVILKSTTVFTYHPTEIMKPISCNLNHCEMFSCILGMEDETALSIIDPVTINMDIICRRSSDGNILKVLRVHMAQLNLRLSYHDVRMFSQMLESLPQQTQYAKSQIVEEEHPVNFRYQLDKLKALGFNIDDCSKALMNCNGHLDDAALWLTQNAVPISYQNSPGGISNHQFGESMFTFNNMEIVMDQALLFIIDDCQDADVPLAEISLSKLDIKQDLEKKSGLSKTVLAIHYYNRFLSGWEPFIESWSCTLCWDHCFGQNLTKTRLELTLASVEVLNMNITSSLVELYKSVKEIWTQDYYNQKESLSRNNSGDFKNSISSPPGYRRRSPFVPFAVKNDTGSRLIFAPITSSLESLNGHRNNKVAETNLRWILVEPNSTVPFSFTERGKVRHRDTHKYQSHQIKVKVEGWQSTSPVTVDRVGVYFRQAFPDIKELVQDMPQARIVLEVTLEGSARKLITVRSALQIHNKLDHMVEIKLNNSHFQKTLPMHLTVCAGDVLSVPLTHALAVLTARPLHAQRNYSFSTKPVQWQHVTGPGQIFYETRQCNTHANVPFRFCTAIKRENYPVEQAPPLAPLLAQVWLQPAHYIILQPPLTIVNLLPYELFYTMKGSGKGKNIIKPGFQHSSCEVDLEKCIELVFTLENFPLGSSLIIPEFTNGFHSRVRLQDSSGRRLHLQAAVISHPGNVIKVSISAPFWLVNKTALPIVFKQEGVKGETAGQYQEHEMARMVAPLLFSFADTDASPTVIARIGNGVHPDGVPVWCRFFTLQPGLQMRRLKVHLNDNRPDMVYMIGIEIRPGRGRYRMTKIVTLTAHYQIHNKSSYKLQIAQRNFISTVSDPGAESTYLTAVPNCYLPFHWPRLDKDQLLCLRIVDVPNCLWSGGFRIDCNTSFHLNIRDAAGRMYFLRVDIVLQGATYFIILTDADTMPPPMRIDNFSKVPITIHQACLTNTVTTVRAGTSTPYAWDEPTQEPMMTIIAPGGVSAEYNLNKLGEGSGLTYENFIYIAFTATFRNASDSDDMLDVECQQLVLDVPDPTTGKVMLSRKQAGQRSQLWRMTADGHLQHEGSAPPRAPSDRVMVLDICGPAPQPTQYVGLVVRRPDRRRNLTQSWKFTEEGRLCCAHSSMCVQAKDGFFGLHKGSEAVLGPPQAVTYQTTDKGIPLEQAVSRQRLRPGSGFLSVFINTDGPTRVLQISDIKEKRVFTLVDEGSWINISNAANASRRDDSQVREVQIIIQLPVVGISLVSRKPHEELLYAYLSGIKMHILLQPIAELLDLSIQDIQIDNQVFEAQSPVTLYVTPITRSSDPEELARPAISISAEKTPNKYSYNADIFKHLVIRVKNISLIIDEKLLLKLIAFVGWNTKEVNENADESDFETQRILAEASSVHAKRYYFGILKILFTQARLSFITCHKLDPELQLIKRQLGFTVIKFEDANVEVQPFFRQHSYESNQILINSIIQHYKDELKWQAGIILGSVDFLGNPIGFVNDLSEGVTGLIYDGNVGALVKNVAHGLSNSAAKVTETLGDGIGRVILDDRHEEIRQRIRTVKSGSSGEHLVAGLKGLGFGLLGGVTSLVRQTYDGAATDGFQGLISGLGKGLVGTVTKPVVGVLDLASETATAVRDSSRSSSKMIPKRKRPPRCVTSPSGFLPPYSKKQSEGQQFLYSINNRKYSELFMAYEILRSGSEDLRIVISSENVRVFSCNPNSNGTTIIVERQLGELEDCRPLVLPGNSMNAGPFFYIELRMVDQGNTSLIAQDGKEGPRVRCDSEAIALWVSQQVNYAKEQFIERQNTLVPTEDNLLED